MFARLYQNPTAAIAFTQGLQVPQEDLREAALHFEDFFQEVFEEFAQYGEVVDMVVSDNIGEHLLGNLYLKYATEEQAEACLGAMLGKLYKGQVIQAEYSPVTDFREAKCRQYGEGACDRGGYCNFIHPKHIDKKVRRELHDAMYEQYPEYEAAAKQRTKDGLAEENDFCRDYVGGGEKRPERHRNRDRRWTEERPEKRDRRGSPSRREDRNRRDRGDRYDDRRDRRDRDRDRDHRQRDKRDDRRDRKDRYRRDSRDRDEKYERRRSPDRDGRYRRDRDDSRDNRKEDPEKDRIPEPKISPVRYKEEKKNGDVEKSAEERSDDRRRGDSLGKAVIRMDSEERRAMIAAWGDNE
jgi:splicing factor U2AF 35 kDa subunit